MRLDVDITTWLHRQIVRIIWAFLALLLLALWVAVTR